MKIRILKCSNSIYWYQKHIGEYFEVIKETHGFYWCRERDTYRAINFIRREDAEEIFVYDKAILINEEKEV